MVQTRFDHVGQRGQVRTPMRVLDTFWPSRRTTGVCQGDHAFLVWRLGLEPIPCPRSVLIIVQQSFLDCFVKRPP